MYLNRAKLALLIDTVIAILAIATRERLSLEWKAIAGAFLFAPIAVGLIGLRKHEETGSVKAAWAALISFLFFVPIGLIGVFAVRGLLRESREGKGNEESESRFPPMTLAASIAVIVGFVVVGALGEYFFNSRNLSMLLIQSAWPVLIAFAVLPAARNGDMDLSLPWISTFTAILAASICASGGSWAAGLAAALLAGAAIGAASGGIAVEASLPAFAVTLAAAAGLQGIGLAVSQLNTIQVDVIPPFVASPGGVFAFIVVGALAAMGLLRIAGENAKAKRIWAFAGSAALAAFAGFFLLARMRAATLSAGGMSTIFVVFAYFWLRSFSSEILGRWGVALALIPAFIWITATNILNLGNVGIEYQILVAVAIAVFFMLTSSWDVCAKRSKRPV